MMKEIQEILSKYSDEEGKIDARLGNYNERSNETATIAKRGDGLPSLEEATKRNKLLLKELELTKSALRSKAIYSPGEIHWADVCRRYREAPSLVVTTWRCDQPIFV